MPEQLLGELTRQELADLLQFAFAEPIRCFTDDPACLSVAQGAGQVKSVREEKIAEQNARLIAPQCVDGGDMAAHGGTVQNIVMHQSRGVNHLDDGGQKMMGRRYLAARLCRQQQESGAETFALVVVQVR